MSSPSPETVISADTSAIVVANDGLFGDNIVKNTAANIYAKGTKIVLLTSTPFTSYTGTIVDPDVVLLGVQINGDDGTTTLLTYTYTHGTGDPTSTIVRTATGTYQAIIDSGLYSSGIWIYSWMGEPSVSVNADTTKTKVRNDNQLIVKPENFPLG